MLQSLVRIRAHIECPMQGHVHGARKVFQPLHPLYIQGSVPQKTARHHAVRPQLPVKGHTAGYDVKLVVRIQEISVPGPDQHMYPDICQLPDLFIQSLPGGSAADDQIRAQFQTVCSSRCGLYRRLRRIHTRLQYIMLQAHPPIPVPSLLSHAPAREQFSAAQIASENSPGHGRFATVYFLFQFRLSAPMPLQCMVVP